MDGSKQSKNLYLCCDFYAVYLLKSIPKNNSTYIGSTSNPIRRLRQHNGDQKGGAFRTKHKTKRPWEMSLLVHRFPNKSIALKFEHAWQHVYKSRFTKKKQKEWNMSKQSNSGLIFKIKALKLLLNTKHFSKFGLELVIFDKDDGGDIYSIWLKDISKYPLDLAKDIFYDKEPHIFSMNTCTSRMKGLMDLTTCAENDIHFFKKANDNIQIVSNFYDEIIQDLNRSKALTNSNDDRKCSFCMKEVTSENICCYNCDFAAHFQCIYPRIANNEGACLLPKHNFDCFGCTTQLNWVTLIKSYKR